MRRVDGPAGGVGRTNRAVGVFHLIAERPEIAVCGELGSQGLTEWKMVVALGPKQELGGSEDTRG